MSYYCKICLLLHLSIGNDEDHLVILGLGLVSMGMKWLVRPIGALKVLWQCGQGMVAAVGDLFVLFFLACLHCSAAAIMLASQVFAPL